MARSAPGVLALAREAGSPDSRQWQASECEPATVTTMIAMMPASSFLWMRPEDRYPAATGDGDRRGQITVSQLTRLKDWMPGYSALLLRPPVSRRQLRAPAK
jgi:hypothetical protein